MSKDTQHFYTATSPLLRAAKLPTPEVTFTSFQQSFTAAHERQKSVKGKARHESLFKPKQHKLPQFLGDQKELLQMKRYWKAAGHNSNRVASAATMYMVEDKDNNWRNAPFAWACLSAASGGPDFQASMATCRVQG